MEVFEVYPETEITRISSPGDNISFAGIQIRIQSGYEFGWKLGTEGFNGGEICEQLQSYLDEYCFRFNRRRSPDQLFSRLARAVAVSALSD